MVKKTVIGLVATAALLGSAGCGRIALTAPGPTRAALLTPNQAMPSDLAGAEQAARAASGLGADAPLVYCVLGPFDAAGRQQDSYEATVLARFARPGGNRPALRTVYLDFQGKARAFWGPVDTTTVYGMHVTFKQTWLDGPQDAVAVDAAHMPSARTAIGWARAAQLPGDEFFVFYQADRDGQVVSVGQWDRGGDVTTIGQVMHFDLQGHQLAADAPEDGTDG